MQNLDGTRSRPWTRSVVTALSVLYLVGCGGGGGGGGGKDGTTSSVANDYQLTLTASAPVAGVQWSANMPSTASTLAELRQQARDTLGVAAQVLSRPTHLKAGQVGTQWLVFARTATGQARWVLLARRQVLASDLPPTEAVQCADAWGNPMACTLTWVIK